ncbi:MAG: MBL fold metallo-hydrolase [Gemmatimonadota bacterium]
MRFVALMTMISFLPDPGRVTPRPTPPQPRQGAVEVVRRAIDAVGGEQALRDLRTIVLDVATFSRTRGQEDVPGGILGAGFLVTRQTRDRAGRRVRNDVESRFAGSTTVNRQTNIATPDGAMLVAPNGNQIVPPPQLQQTALAGLETFVPVMLLKLLDRPDSIAAAPPRRIGGQLDDGVRFVANGVPTTIWFDRITGLPALQESVTDDGILGDNTTTVVFSHWSTGTVRIPGQIRSEGGRGETQTIQRVISLNQPIPDSVFAIPDSTLAKYRQQPAAPAQIAATAVTLTSLAPGVWRAGGQYNALVVEQPNQLVLVEAPLSVAFVQALLDTLTARFPAKRVGVAVNTHHHWDHAGGIRAVLAAGIPVVTRTENVDFIRSIGAAKKTVKPDALSKGRKMPAITGFTDSMTIGSRESRVVLYAVTTAQDAGLHLVAFVPSAGVLFQSDILTASANPQFPLPKVAAKEILTIAEQRGLTLKQVVGGHGSIATIDAITAAAK